MYKNILFDLDGTLTDPGIGITGGVAFALDKFGITEKERDKLNRFVGPPLGESFHNFYGIPKEECDNAIKYYREYYSVTGLFENELYEGISELLAELKDKGCKVILATSKPEEFSVKILKHFDLYKFFDFIGAATMDGSRSDKADVIRYAIEECGIDNLCETIMVGDRKHDIIGAKTLGIDSVGVLYGYGDRKEHEAAGATYIVDSVAKLAEFFRR